MPRRADAPKNRPGSPHALTPPTPFFEGGGICLYHGDCLELLPRLVGLVADAIVTDPPYSSGGLTAAERQRNPADKYCQDSNTCGRPTFSGDSRDQRSYAYWSTLWLTLCRRLVRPDGYCLVFSDWRQLPTMTDVLQAGGYVWRGIVPWDKGRGARAPHKGYFRHQCEYVIWGTSGACRAATHAGPFDGCLRETVKRADKWHITGKPTALMVELVKCIPAGSLVLDPFAGSCTTAVACALAGRRCVAIEQSAEYCEIGRRRILEALEKAGKIAP